MDRIYAYKPYLYVYFMDIQSNFKINWPGQFLFYVVLILFRALLSKLLSSFRF